MNLGMYSVLLWKVCSLPNITRNKKMFLRCSSRELDWCWTVCELLMDGFVMVRSLLVPRSRSKLVILPLREGSSCVAGKAQFGLCWMDFCPRCVDASTACQAITVRESSLILLVLSCPVNFHWCASLMEMPNVVSELAGGSLALNFHWSLVSEVLQPPVHGGVVILGICRVAAFCRMSAEEEVNWKEIININEDIRHWQNWESHPSLWAPFLPLISLRALRSISYNYFLIIVKPQQNNNKTHRNIEQHFIRTAFYFKDSWIYLLS